MSIGKITCHALYFTIVTPHPPQPNQTISNLVDLINTFLPGGLPAMVGRQVKDFFYMKKWNTIKSPWKLQQR